MHALRLLACLAYWGLLTVLLLLPDPDIVGLDRMKLFPWGDTGVHFTAFTLLALVVHASRWPKRPDWWILVLIVYGIVMESLQALAPPRTVELKDYIENVLGVAAGSAVVWLAWKRRESHRGSASMARIL